MHRKMTLALVATVLIAADDSRPASAAGEKIQGTWIVAAIESRGKREEPPHGAYLIIRGDSLTTKVGGRTLNATFTVDDAKSPAQIDVVVSKDDASPYRGKTLHGIYSINGDILKWSTCEPGDKDRPKEIGAKDDGKTTTMTCRRERN